MSEIFRKLNLKEQKELLVLNAPETFESEITSLDDIRVRRSLDDIGNIGFSLAFVKSREEVDTLSSAIARKAVGDAVLWFAYPKASSKKYTCDFNRDTGWDVLSTLGFKGVRQVAVDQDWSALRFRQVEYVTVRGKEKAD